MMQYWNTLTFILIPYKLWDIDVKLAPMQLWITLALVFHLQYLLQVVSYQETYSVF